MTPHINDYTLPGVSGFQVSVELEITEEEHNLIYEHRMLDIDIGQHRGQKLTFGDFYTDTKITVWDIDSAHQVRLFIDYLHRGFADFNRFLASNRRGTGPEPETAFNFFDHARFEHTWIKGDQGTGKTTLLSALIDADLEKVADGKASVLVLDSQDEHLGRYLPHREVFAPGGRLGGKLIYLEPDLDHPLALNIFDFKNYHSLSKNDQLAALETAQEMLTFFIGVTVGVPSGHMKNIIGFALRALVLIPDATVFTFKDLLINGRLKRLLKDHPKLNTLDDKAKTFLLTDMFNANYSPSVGAIASRLDAFSSNPFIEACFSQPRNKFQLYDLLKEPSVIVINMKEKLLREERTALLGRYFLASLLSVVRTRTGGGLPCYVFVDEAHQYIAEEEIVTQLISMARRQKIALTFSHQRRSDIKSTTVLKALEGCGVQINPANKHLWWGVQVRKGELTEVKPPAVDFEHEPQMARHHWASIMQKMHDDFSLGAPKPIQSPTGGAPNISEE